MISTAIVSKNAGPADVVSPPDRASLAAWFNLYMGLEAGANADNTIAAKTRDLKAFLDFFGRATGCDQADLWTRSISGDFVKALQADKRSPTTINRTLATLRHCASWVHRQRPFLAGNPTERIAGIAIDDPEWKGLSDMELTRLKAAAEQLIHVKRRRNQQPIRDFAIFHVLLRTGLRVSELLRLDLDQYRSTSSTLSAKAGKSHAVFSWPRKPAKPSTVILTTYAARSQVR